MSDNALILMFLLGAFLFALIVGVFAMIVIPRER